MSSNNKSLIKTINNLNSTNNEKINVLTGTTLKEYDAVYGTSIGSVNGLFFT